MNRVEEIRKEKGISREEIAKILGITIESYNDWINREGNDREEKVAIRLGVPKSYLSGKTNYLSQGERQFRKDIKEVAQSELENGYFNGIVPDEYRTAVNQLCTAANLIRVVESIEELSDKVGELNDTIYSYGMWASSQP